MYANINVMQFKKYEHRVGKESKELIKDIENFADIVYEAHGWVMVNSFLNSAWRRI